MKKVIKNIVKTCVSALLAFGCAAFAGCGEILQGIKTYDDVTIYQTKSYLDEEKFATGVIKMCEYADKFFPEYGKEGFCYDSVSFTLNDAQYTLLYGWSATVQFGFENEESYQKAVERVEKKYTFLEEAVYTPNGELFASVIPQNEFDAGWYHCKVVKEDTYTDYPKHFGVIGYNETGYFIRFTYFYDDTFTGVSGTMEDFITYQTGLSW